MCSADAIADPEAQRAALAAELMAELGQIRAVGMKLIREIDRPVEENPEQAADSELVLRFQRVAQTVSRAGALQLALIDGQTNFAQAAEVAGRRRAAVRQREQAKAGKELKAKCVYLFAHEVLAPAEAQVGKDTVAAMKKDLFRWMFDTEDAPYASKRIGEIMIEMTRAIGIEPPYDEAGTADWEAKVHQRWAPLDQAWGRGPFPDEGPPRSGPIAETAAPPGNGAKPPDRPSDLSWAHPGPP